MILPGIGDTFVGKSQILFCSFASKRHKKIRALLVIFVSVLFLPLDCKLSRWFCWGTKVGSSTVSELNQKIYGKIEEWRMQPIHGEHPYIFVDGVYLKRSWDGEVQNVSVLVAVGVNDKGYCEILGVAEGSREDKESWSNFLRYLKERGLKGVRLIVSDKCLGLYEIIGDFFPAAKWQRCIVHWYRNAFTMCPWKHIREVVAMLRKQFMPKKIKLRPGRKPLLCPKNCAP